MFAFTPASRAWLGGWALLALALVPCRLAQAAQHLETLSRGAGPGADKAAALVGHYLREAFVGDERYEALPTSPMQGNTDRDRALKSFGEAEQAAYSAREAYDRLELDIAASQARLALSRYERFAPYVDDFKKVAETLMLMGAVSFLRGEERAGMQALEQAINVYPSVEPDPRVFNPAMRAQFSQVAARLAARPGGTLSITSTPGYAEVFVDGRFVGVSPVVVQNVSEGRHYVRLKKDGFRPAGKVMQVTSRLETTDSMALRTAGRFEEYDSLAGNVTAELSHEGDKEGRGPVVANRRALGKFLQADVLLVARVRLDGERVHITAVQFDAHTGRATHQAEHVFAYDTRPETYAHEVQVMLQQHFMGTEATAQQAEAAAVAAKKTPLASDRDILPHAGYASRCMGGRVSCRGLKITVASSLLALGIGGLVTGAAEYALAGNTHARWARLPQVSPELGKLRVVGKNQALLGDIMMGAGAAFTVAGSLTFALWHPAPGAHDVARSQHAQQENHEAARNPGRLALSMRPLLGGGAVMADLSF